jgi:alkylhydroperoxidase family enzyme
MTAYLAPIDKPRSLRLRLLAVALKRVFGKAPSWLTVWSARMPFSFTTWVGKVNSLNKKLTVDPDLVVLLRARVDDVNTCLQCQDAGRWYVNKKRPHLAVKLDALFDYRRSAMYSVEERAALDFATELAEHRSVSPDTFRELSAHYSDRQVCEIVWVVSSNFLLNINNLGMGIGSDGLCELAGLPKAAPTVTPL